MELKLYIYLGVYILLLIGVSFFVSRKQKKEDFLIANRDRGFWQILLSKFATTIGAGYFITYTGFAYEYGLGVFALLIGTALGFLVYAYWAAPLIKKFSDSKRFYTIGNFVHFMLKDSRAEKTADLLSSSMLFAWLVTTIIAGGKIISEFGLLSYSSAVIITSGVILAYIIIAGYKAVLITDVVQSVVILVLVAVTAFAIVNPGSLSQVINTKTSSLDVGVGISFLIFGLLSVFSYSDRFQLAYAAKTTKALKTGLAFSIIPILIVAGFLLLIGLFMAGNSPGLESNFVFTEALRSFLSPDLLPLAMVLFFAGIMSSADTNVYAIASHYALNIKGNSVLNVKRGTVFVLLLVSVLALLFPDVVDVSIFAGALSLSLSLPILYILFGGKNGKKFFYSALGSIVGLVLGIIFLGIEPTITITTLLGGFVGLILPFRK